MCLLQHCDQLGNFQSSSKRKGLWLNAKFGEQGEKMHRGGKKRDIPSE